MFRIDAIPSKQLETIKEWLTSVKIKYYESKLNLAWKPVLKNIMADPEGFVANGVCVCVCVVVCVGGALNLAWKPMLKHITANPGPRFVACRRCVWGGGHMVCRLNAHPTP